MGRSTVFNPASGFNTTTDSGGNIATQTLTEFMANSTNTTTSSFIYFTNYTVNGSKSGYLNDSKIVNLTQSQNVTLVLNATSANTCTPTAGQDWTIEASDNCTIVDKSYSVLGVIIKGGPGTFTVQNSNITATYCAIRPGTGKNIVLVIKPTTAWTNGC